MTVAVFISYCEVNVLLFIVFCKVSIALDAGLPKATRVLHQHVLFSVKLGVSKILQCWTLKCFMSQPEYLVHKRQSGLKDVYLNTFNGYSYS